MAILDKTDYVKKRNAYINDRNCEVLKRDPNLAIFRKTQELVRRGSCSKYMRKFMKINFKRVTPRLIGGMKGVKPGFPMRPIVSR